ncbi:hypothetical protein [Jeongeupia sp. USM3]|uniref:hypothetical protein n=1 Tax=Jeongeupia sp. USM3 TaxID=1906741 RepID=UPI00089DFDB6|nr:hypothetical protein [Jeongeupia sp. USM3]AOY00649.1 hypothetical protein BJP62_09515 [Jeongeupia sp. USM3]
MSRNVAGRCVPVLAILLMLQGGSACAFEFADPDPWHGSDKVAHFSVSVALGAGGREVASDSAHPQLYGVILAVVPGVAKEVLDGIRQDNDFSYKDLLFDLVGAISGAYLGNTIMLRSSHDGQPVFGLQYGGQF